MYINAHLEPFPRAGQQYWGSDGNNPLEVIVPGGHSALVGPWHALPLCF